MCRRCAALVRAWCAVLASPLAALTRWSCTALMGERLVQRWGGPVLENCLGLSQVSTGCRRVTSCAGAQCNCLSTALLKQALNSGINPIGCSSPCACVPASLESKCSSTPATNSDSKITSVLITESMVSLI